MSADAVVLRSPAGDEAGGAQPSERPSISPTHEDIENARVRQEIAERQEAAYAECLAWALQTFGPGWRPSHRHYLVEKDDEERARLDGGKPIAAATVYTVRNACGEARHFTVEGGKIVPQESYETGFGQMLLEPHPTRGFEHNGTWCRAHRYSLCWAGYELYHAKSAEQLAELRANRERSKAAREDTKWAEENPLFAWAGLKRDG